MSDHRCFKEVNARLKEMNPPSRLFMAVSFPSGEEHLAVRTVKIGSEKPGVSLYASYCPFCGVKLGQEG